MSDYKIMNLPYRHVCNLPVPEATGLLVGTEVMCTDTYLHDGRMVTCGKRWKLLPEMSQGWFRMKPTGRNTWQRVVIDYGW